MNIRNRNILLLTLAVTGCDPGGDPNALTEQFDTSGAPIIGGAEVSGVAFRAGEIWIGDEDGSGSVWHCTGTVIDPWWVLTSKQCLDGPDGATRNPEYMGIFISGASDDYGSSGISHIALHPKHREGVDVAMLRLAAPIPGLPLTEVPIWPFTFTAPLYNENVYCYGANSISHLNAGTFQVVPDPAGSPYYGLVVPNAQGQTTGPHDIGGSCLKDQWITGVHTAKKSQVSAVAWASWAEKRRDCPVFDPRSPSTGFCSVDCPCDVGEGDCDSDAQCQPGLYCRSVAAFQSVLPSGYDVCDVIPARSCGTMNPNNPNPSLCTKECPCLHGEGDCDSHDDCGGSMRCQDDSGYAVGLPDQFGICVHQKREGCMPYIETWFPMAEQCSTECPCDLGQGDCDSDDECLGGLVCVNNIGAHFGKPADYDMCAYAGAPSGAIAGSEPGELRDGN